MLTVHNVIVALHIYYDNLVPKSHFPIPQQFIPATHAF